MIHPQTAGDGGRGERPPPPADSNWQEQAVCASVDPDLFFPPKGLPSREAKSVCSGCPVRVECLEYALTIPLIFGVWGGTTEQERRKLKPASYTSRKVAMSDIEKRRNEVRRLHAAGLTDPEVASRMGMASDSIARIRRRIGLKPNVTKDLTSLRDRERNRARRRRAS